MARRNSAQGFFTKIPKEYDELKLGDLNLVDHDQILPKSVDHNNLKSIRVCRLAGRVRFELTTSSLEGWLVIRAATSAQTKLEIKDRRSRFKVSYRFVRRRKAPSKAIYP